MKVLKPFVNNATRRAAKRIVFGGLAALTLSLTALHPAVALPPIDGGGGGTDGPKPKPVYKAELRFSEVFKESGYDVRVYIQNVGNATSTPCSLGAFVYDTYPHCVGAKDVNVPAIKPGETALVWVKSDFYLFLSGYSYKFWVDHYNQVNEFDETNNFSMFTNAK